MNSNKLQVKDLINIGIFTAIYFVVFFLCGMTGYIPFFMLVIPFLCPLASGIPFMLYLTRVKHFGMITITGFICGVLMLLTGMSWQPVVSGVVFGLLADLILKSGRYRSSKRTILAYTVFSVWLMGMMFPLYFARDAYFTQMIPVYGQEYVDALLSYTPMWTFYLMAALSALGGFIGALLGKATLKKHFQKAGIV
jgi:energy-coupling factor transport system substrate-specific component